MAQKVKDLPVTQETSIQSLGGEDPGESHGQRGLVGYSPQGHTEQQAVRDMPGRRGPRAPPGRAPSPHQLQEAVLGRRGYVFRVL